MVKTAMSDAFFRFLEASGCRTQEELAGFLQISQSSVAYGSKRKIPPATWLVKLLRARGTNPDWVLRGEGPKLLLPANSRHGPLEPQTNRDDPPAGGKNAAAPESFLERFSAQDLVNELVRRALGGA